MLKCKELLQIKGLVFGIFLTRLAIATALVVYFLNLYSPLASAFGLVALFSTSLIIFSSRRISESIYHRLESRFLEHLKQADQRIN